MMQFTTAQVERMHSWANTCFWSHSELMEPADAELYLHLRKLLSKPDDGSHELKLAQEMLDLPPPPT